MFDLGRISQVIALLGGTGSGGQAPGTVNAGLRAWRQLPLRRRQQLARTDGPRDDNEASAMLAYGRHLQRPSTMASWAMTGLMGAVMAAIVLGLAGRPVATPALLAFCLAWVVVMPLLQRARGRAMVGRAEAYRAGEAAAGTS